MATGTMTHPVLAPPTTELGRLAGWLYAVAIVAAIVFESVMAIGVSPSDSAGQVTLVIFFLVMALVMGLAGSASLVLAWIAILRKRERSIVDFLAAFGPLSLILLRPLNLLVRFLIDVFGG